MNRIHCDSSNINESIQIFKNNTTHIRLDCTNCGNFIGYKPKLVLMKDAVEFKMPFGKHKDELISDLVNTDFNYVMWLAKECQVSKIRTIASMLLTEAYNKDNP